MQPADPGSRDVGRGKLKHGMMRPRGESAPLSSARAALRTATHDIHERMHCHPGLARLAAGTIDQDEYRNLLARSYGFYAVLEPLLGLSRRLTDCLVQDLAELGMTAAAVEDLSHCAPPPLGQGIAAVGKALRQPLGDTQTALGH